MYFATVDDMSSEAELREVENRIQNANPSRGLENQVPPDEEIKWVVKQDLRTAWFNLILHKLKMVVFFVVVGVVAGIFVTGAAGAALGMLTVLLISLGAPIGYVGVQYYYLKNTEIEYAATDSQFIRYEDSPSTTKTDTLQVNRAKDAKFRQDLWDNFFDTGDISINAIGRAKSLRIKDVPDAEAVHRVIQHQIAETDQVDDVAVAQRGSVRRGDRAAQG